MSAKIPTCDLLKRICQIVNTAIHANEKHFQFKDITYADLTMGLFRDEQLHAKYLKFKKTESTQEEEKKERGEKGKKEKEEEICCALKKEIANERGSLRKIDTDKNRHLSIRNIYSFIDHFYNEGNYYDFILYILSARTDSEDVKLNAIIDSILEEEQPQNSPLSDSAIFDSIHKLYLDINPYPWFNFEEDYAKLLEEKERNDSEYYDHGLKLVIDQLIFLFVNHVFNYRLKTTQEYMIPDCIFEDAGSKKIVIPDVFGTQRIDKYLHSHPTSTTGTSYYICNTIKSYGDLLSVIMPDYIFWKNDYKKNLGHCPNIDPFSCNLSRIIKEIVCPDDLLIIKAPISTEMVDFVQNLPCKTVYFAKEDSFLVKQNTIPIISMEKIMFGLISSITDDDREKELLYELVSKLGFHANVYYLIDKYYKSYEKKEHGLGKKFLNELKESNNLYKVEDTLERIDHQKVSSRIPHQNTTPDKPNSSGRLFRNAVLKLYTENLDAKERQMLRILCRLQEIDTTVSCYKICILAGQENLYKKLIAYGWITDNDYHIPEIIVASVSYKSNLTNEEYDFYLDIMFKFSEILLGHCKETVDIKLYSALINCFHLENMHFLSQKADLSERELNRIYFNPLKKSALTQTYIDFRENKADPPITTEKIKDSYTDLIFEHSVILHHFYNSAIIFCYEYGLTTLAKTLISDIQSSRSVLHATDKEHKNDDELQLMVKLWNTYLFPSEKVKEEIHIEKIFTNDTYHGLLKPLLLTYLRFLLSQIEKTFFIYVMGFHSMLVLYKQQVLHACMIINICRNLGVDAEAIYPCEFYSIHLYVNILQELFHMPESYEEKPEMLPKESCKQQRYFLLHKLLCSDKLNTENFTELLTNEIGDISPFMKKNLHLLHSNNRVGGGD